MQSMARKPETLYNSSLLHYLKYVSEKQLALSVGNRI